MGGAARSYQCGTGRRPGHGRTARPILITLFEHSRPVLDHCADEETVCIRTRTGRREPDRRPADRIRFWNLTANTITEFYLAPAGTDKYGPDQCVNDRDGMVDHDERLRITGVTPGRYDAKFQDKKGRVCVGKNIDVKAGAIFSIEERQVSNC